MQAGDLIFFPTSGRWYERVIIWATHGRFVHVAVAVSDSSIIAAEVWGIREEPLPADHPSALAFVSLSPASPAAAQVALAWLRAQLGKRYGWEDIFDQVFRLLRLPFYFGSSEAFDCSDLAACFAALYTNDRGLMTLVLDRRETISPNDLARYYKLPA